jgi:MFS family permease
MLSIRHPFGKIALIQLLVDFVIAAQYVVIGWQIYADTGNYLALGATGLAEAIPYLSCVLFAGVWVDHADPVRLLRYSLAGLGASSLLVAGSFFISLPTDQKLALFYIALFVQGLARALFSPSIHATWARILPPDRLTWGTTWGSNASVAGDITGPALGGMCYTLFGPRVTILILCSVLLASWMLSLRVPSLGVVVRPYTESLRQRLASGLNFVRHRQVLWASMSLDMIAVLFGGATALLPAFAQDVWHVQADVLGWLRAAPFLGALVMGLVLTRHPPQRRSGILLFAAVGVFGLCMLGFAVSPHWLWGFGFLILSGAADHLSVVIRGAISTNLTPNEMRGRVSAVSRLFIGSSNELGALESGLAAAWLGLVPSVVAGSCVTIAVVACGCLAWPALRRFNLCESRSPDSQ